MSPASDQRSGIRGLSATDLADVCAVWRRATGRINGGIANQQVVVGAVKTERIIRWRADLVARLPPAMLAAHHTWIERIVQPGAGSHRTVRTFDHHPVTWMDIARSRDSGVHLHLRVWNPATQAGQASMLTFAELGIFGRGQHQGVPTREVRPRARADQRFAEFRDRRIAVLEKRLRVQLSAADAYAQNLA